MKRVQQGFTLIELMIVVAIIGILAAVAIPAYTDYTARAKVTEAVGALASAKTSVSEFYTSQGVMPKDAAEAGINTAPAGKYVKGITYTQTSGTVATLEVELQAINTAANGKKFALTGTGDTDKGITWECSKGDTPEKFLPANCRK
ncbi:type IV pilus assembly protein PilA [Chitinivorax tropicus]|uniref:Type IV pilus assembly protein PilA n=1 Tax=Chitinivorax tropicus TaxID=714531 RepID=A0A840MP83_9PROT|nr:pilin [Chitinivorax tropicus]MBB5020250.1 type IV pilus assembly protein PilA [Chitinivorax tropicus]